MKKPKGIHSERIAHVLSVLREGQRKGRWKAKKEGEDRFRVQTGTFKNGKPKFGTKCANCGVTAPTNKEKFWATDHIAPVRGISGFIDFDTEVERMLPDKYGYQKICSICHTAKTEEESDYRTRYRAAKGDDKQKLLDEFNKKWYDLREKLMKEFP